MTIRPDKINDLINAEISRLQPNTNAKTLSILVQSILLTTQEWIQDLQLSEEQLDLPESPIKTLAYLLRQSHD